MDRHVPDKTLHCADLEEGVAIAAGMECIVGRHVELSNCSVSLPAKYDGRLFADEALYCEGHHKPLLRGVIHLLSALMLPTVLYLFLQASRGSPLAIISSVLYISSNIFCYGVSGVYHVFSWSAEYEIWLQKLDHCGITILSVGTIVPDSLLLLPFFPYGVFMLTISLCLCIRACQGILKGNPSMKWQVIVAVWWVIPYLYPNYMLMTSAEFNAMLSCCLFQAIGAFIFASRQPDIYRTICGYHEVFHFFVVLAGVSVIFCNFSIVKRYGDNYWLENHVN